MEMFENVFVVADGVHGQITIAVVGSVYGELEEQGVDAGGVAVLQEEVVVVISECLLELEQSVHADYR